MGSQNLISLISVLVESIKDLDRTMQLHTEVVRLSSNSPAIDRLLVEAQRAIQVDNHRQ